MENKLFVITKEEKDTITKRTQELAQAVASGGGREGYYAYAKANGYSEEEAHTLINEVVIPRVDEYNASCRDAYNGDSAEWIRSKLAENIEKQGMDPQEAAKYKLGVLQAIRGLNAQILEEENEDFLTDDERELLEKAEFTEEMIQKIDDTIVEAIDNSAMPLYTSQAFETFLEGKADEESVRAVTWELWQDEQLKYCAAAAMCIAKHNGELPSIPEDTSDELLVLSACQGVDVANIETKVGIGEMAADTAFKILKVIGGVVLTLAVGWVLWLALKALASLGVTVAFALFGAGTLGILVACFFAYQSVSSISEMAEAWLNGGLGFVGKIADTTYGAIKKGVKTLSRITREKIVPVVKKAMAVVKDTICGIAAAVYQFVRNKAFAAAKA